MKFSFRSLGIFSLFFIPSLVLAGSTYQPLLPIAKPGGGTLYSSNILEYLKNIYTFGIAIVGGLAVIKIVYGGIIYMLSDVVTNKSDAKKEIWAAVVGLLMALGSATILFTINPDLLKFNFNITPTDAIVGDGRELIPNSISGPVAGLSGGGTAAIMGPDGQINPKLTAYSPQKKGSSIGTMEGGYASSRAGLDGQSIVRTLDDYASGASSYVTLAGDPSQYGKTYTLPSITYTNSSGVTQTLTNVKAYVHDTGGAFKTAGTSRFDVPVGRDYTNSQMNNQNFLK